MALTAEEKRFLLDVARKALIKVREKGTHPFNLVVTPALKEDGAAIVRLLENGKIRGAAGAVYASKPLLDAVVSNTLDAASSAGIKKEEIQKINIEINIVHGLKNAEADNIDTSKDGVAFQYNNLRSVFLPGGRTKIGKDALLSVLCERSGLDRDFWRKNRFELKKFFVENFSDEDRN